MKEGNSNVGHRGAFSRSNIHNTVSPPALNCCTSSPHLSLALHCLPGLHSSEGSAPPPSVFTSKLLDLNMCVGANGKSLSFIQSFIPTWRHAQRSGSAPEIAPIVHHGITSSFESVPPPVLLSAHPSLPLSSPLGTLDANQCLPCCLCRDEEKGKKMWSKYLEREDSKIVGEFRKNPDV